MDWIHDLICQDFLGQFGILGRYFHRLEKVLKMEHGGPVTFILVMPLFLLFLVGRCISVGCVKTFLKSFMISLWQSLEWNPRCAKRSELCLSALSWT